MSEFFRGWKRKTGLVLLCIACAFAAGWMRSLSKMELFALELKRFSVRLVSTDELVGFQAFWLLKPSTRSNLRFISGRSNTNTVHTEYLQANFRGRFPQFPTVPLPRTWLTEREFGLGRFRTIISKASWNDIRFVEVRVPYWSIVLPCLLMSTGLLFASVPRRPRSTSETSNIDHKVTEVRHDQIP